MLSFLRFPHICRLVPCAVRGLTSFKHVPFSIKPEITNISQFRSIQVSKFVGGQIDADHNCWKCAENVRPDKFFCDNCNVIQKSDKDVDYYQLFGIEESFEIDGEDLSQKFKRMQMLLHPDKFSMRSKEELALAEEYSSLINKAYSVLKDPWLRGLYLLQKLGVLTDEETTLENPSLLMYVMERNEAVAAAKEINKLLREDVANKADIESVVISINKAFANSDLDEVKNQLTKLKYFTNIDRKISDRKFEFGITE